MDSTTMTLDAHPAPLDVPGADMDDRGVTELVVAYPLETSEGDGTPRAGDSDGLDRAIFAALVNG
jgi:hypothetical protein